MKTNKTSHKDIVIMGAGLAGLAAGYELTKAGFKVTLVERNDDVGGLARTLEKDGFRFDTGPHRWYTKNDMVNNWMLNLLGDEVIQVPRLTRIYFDNTFFHYPIKLKSTLIGMGMWATIRAVIDYVLVRLQGLIIKRDPVNLEDGYVHKFGRTLYKLFFKRYSEKLWGTSCKNISADWIGQRTRGFNIITVIKDALFKKNDVVSFVDEFSYPKRGIGRIAQKMAEEIRKDGGTILLNTEVLGVKHKDGKIVSVIAQEKNKQQTLTGDDFINSIAISDLAAMIQPKADAKVMLANNKFTYRDEIQVTLFVNKSHLTPDTWIYVHSLKVPFIRFMEMDNWSDKLGPKGKTALVFELACNEGDELWEQKDESIVNMVKSAFIDEFGLITNKQIIGSYVHRVPKEYPVYHIGYKDDLKIIRDYLGQFSNLQTIGRNGLFRYNNMDHSIEMGLYAAWNIIEGARNFDVDTINIEREYLEEKRVKHPEFVEDEGVEERH